MVLRSLYERDNMKVLLQGVSNGGRDFGEPVAGKRPADLIACSVNFQGWPTHPVPVRIIDALQLPESQVPCRSAEPFTSLMTIPLC